MEELYIVNTQALAIVWRLFQGAVDDTGAARVLPGGAVELRSRWVKLLPGFYVNLKNLPEVRHGNLQAAEVPMLLGLLMTRVRSTPFYAGNSSADIRRWYMSVHDSMTRCHIPKCSLIAASTRR